MYFSMSGMMIPPIGQVEINIPQEMAFV